MYVKKMNFYVLKNKKHYSRHRGREAECIHEMVHVRTLRPSYMLDSERRNGSKAQLSCEADAFQVVAEERIYTCHPVLDAGFLPLNSLKESC
jgi:hypothetical protein